MSNWIDLPDGLADSTTPVWTKYSIGYAALAAAATTNNITLLTLPAKTLITRVVIRHTEAFSGGSLSSYTISVGIAGTLAKYCAAFDVFQAVSGTAFGVSTVAQTLESFTSDTAIKVAAVGSHNLNTATTGSVDIYVQTAELP
jgi:hypothetical protein